MENSHPSVIDGGWKDLRPELLPRVLPFSRFLRQKPRSQERNLPGRIWEVQQVEEEQPIKREFCQKLFHNDVRNPGNHNPSLLYSNYKARRRPIEGCPFLHPDFRRFLASFNN